MYFVTSAGMHLVARRAEFGRAMHRLEESAPVERRFGFHQLLVEVLQKRARAEREGILKRLLDQVVAVAARAVHLRDRVTHRAS